MMEVAQARLIVEGQTTPAFAYPGVENMAIDETLLRSAAEDGVTTLRFYGWEPATLSLGYFQNIADRESHLASGSCDLVRRASGGGAILHDNELTYCFATPTKTRFGDAEEYYLAFHETLVELLREQGVQAHLHDSETGLSDDAFLCFQRRASSDIILDGHKITGSAQRRWKTGLVQHGSILLERSAKAPELPGLRDLATFNVSTTWIVQSWLEKLGSRLKLEFAPTKLADKETILFGQLQKDKFSSERWNARR